MYAVVIIMIAGIALGYLFRIQKRLVSLVDKLTMWAIYLLLFLLGVAIGANDIIMKNLPNLGITAITISTGGVIGSVLLAWLLNKILFKQKKNWNEK